MNVVFHVSGDPDVLLVDLCPFDERGHVDFGWSPGRSRVPTDHQQLFAGQAEFVGYVLEGFVTYTVSLERAPDGLRFIVRKTGDSPRDNAIDWFLEQYLRSQGSAVSKNAL